MNGVIARIICGVTLPIQVIQSANGYYIGTQEEGMPYSRESVEFWETKNEADMALGSGNWTQKKYP